MKKSFIAIILSVLLINSSFSSEVREKNEETGIEKNLVRFKKETLDQHKNLENQKVEEPYLSSDILYEIFQYLDSQNLLLSRILSKKCRDLFLDICKENKIIYKIDILRKFLEHSKTEPKNNIISCYIKCAINTDSKEKLKFIYKALSVNVLENESFTINDFNLYFALDDLINYTSYCTKIKNLIPHYKGDLFFYGGKKYIFPIIENINLLKKDIRNEINFSKKIMKKNVVEIAKDLIEVPAIIMSFGVVLIFPVTIQSPIG